MRVGRSIAITSLLLALAIVGGCAGDQTPAEEDHAPTETEEAVSLDGTSWTAVSFNPGGVPRDVPADTPITAEFSDGTMSGNATVNATRRATRPTAETLRSVPR